MTNPRYLTKSRFKLAMDCPTKLFYTKKDEYPDQSIDDSFLLALARGGFQVGELAKCYFPGGVEVETFDYAAVAQMRVEAKQKLAKVRPANVGQASRISGITPADLSVLLFYLQEGS